MDFYIKQSKSVMSEKKREGYLRLAEVVNWGRKYPVRFVERFLGISLLDYQKYIFMKSWVTQFCVWCQCRSSGKSTLGSPFIMTKSLLIPNFQGYLLAGDGSQSKELFLKIEKIAKREIESFTGLTDVFYNELVKSAANTDGFTHNPNSFEYKVFNGAKVNTLNSVPDNLRSKRSNCNFYDEAGFIPEELFVATEPFTTQNSNFSLGGEIDATLRPLKFPNQLIYASSASSIDTYFFKKYKEFSKKMFLGDSNYFVADIKDEVVMSATYNGKVYPVPLLTQDTIDNAMRENPEKANREYKNIFSKEGGDNQIIKRATIIKNSKTYAPTLYNNNNSVFLMAYDPARKHDNAVIMIAELFEDPDVGYKLRICNGVNFLDLATKKKQQLQTPDQIKILKQMLLDYNGEKKADYENIHKLLIDAGAGGAGVTISDYFMEDWTDSKGVSHKGLIDKIESQDYINKFPNAIDVLRLLSPHKYKKDMFDALIDMMNLGLIEFPHNYEGRGYIVFDENIEKTIEIEKNKKKVIVEQKQKTYKLSDDEKLALVNIDLAKEELVNIYRFDGTNGNYRYDLSPEKKSKMGDDRAYCLAMLAWELKNIRRERFTKKVKKPFDVNKAFHFRTPKIHS